MTRPYLLDTSTISNLLDRQRVYPLLAQRLLSVPMASLFISVISIAEIMQGILAAIRRVSQQDRVIQQYQQLQQLFEDLHRFQILPYTEEAERVYQALPPSIKRIGTQDCRIAAIANTTNMIVVTANPSDFIKIDLAEVQDWTY